MKLVTFSRAGEPRLGAIVGAAIVDLNLACAALLRSRGAADPEAFAAATLPPDATAFLALGEAAVSTAGEAIEHVGNIDNGHSGLSRPLASATLLPPVPEPPKVICVARNYAEHARETGSTPTEVPDLFARFKSTLIGAGAAVLLPRVSDQLDWEGELAVVIGEGGSHIARADALSHVAGYSIFNDLTVRDYQTRVSQFTTGKNFRASGPFGPYLLSADEAGDPQALEITTTVNGEVKQLGSTADMVFDVATLIKYVSEWIDLEPGDVIATGTPHGVGFSREPPEFLRSGDTVAVSITGLGTLSNPVLAE